ncbi:hypothetical protein [Deinococcus ficus]|uniref:Uncharacterized protein n=1 Tax=Deinococcus ficus TaxID=317577 RepID=A0A221T2S9_9DEIO|nr:hypothetical protein [Deinococcus ficus]ASN83156.1 hypothetical protein DFI_18320 [Deinococcus ficus]
MLKHFMTALLSAAVLSSATAATLQNGSVLDQVIWKVDRNMTPVGQYQGLALYAAASAQRPNVVMLVATNSLNAGAWKWCESTFAAGEVIKALKPGRTEGDIDVTLARGETLRVVTINAAHAHQSAGLGTGRCGV